MRSKLNVLTYILNTMGWEKTVRTWSPTLGGQAGQLSLAQGGGRTHNWALKPFNYYKEYTFLNMHVYEDKYEPNI